MKSKTSKQNPLATLPTVAPPTSSSTRKKVFVIGGGFAGLDALRNLKGGCDPVLLDRRDFHEYTPDVPEALVMPSHTSKITKTFESCRNVSTVIVCKEVLSFDPVGKRVRYSTQEESEKEESFDFAILCTGASYTSPIKSSR